MELLVMWGTPVLFLLLAGQSPLFQNWRFLIALSFGFYLALGCSPFALDMGRAWFPKELAAYSTAGTLLVSTVFFAFVLHHIMAGVTTHGNGGYHLPKQKNLLIQAFGFFSGYVFSALVGLVICTCPMNSRLGVNEAFACRAVSRSCVVTGVIDTFSLQISSTVKRKKRLMNLVAGMMKKPARPAVPAASVNAKKETSDPVPERLPENTPAAEL